MPYIKHHTGDLSSRFSLILRRIAAIRSTACRICSGYSFLSAIFAPSDIWKFHFAAGGGWRSFPDAAVGKTDHGFASSFHRQSFRESSSEHGATDSTSCDTVKPVVVGAVGFELPFVHCSAATLGLDFVFGGQVFCQKLMYSGNSAVQRKIALVAAFHRQTGVDEALPKVCIVDDVTDRPFSCYIWDHPVEAQPIPPVICDTPSSASKKLRHTYRGTA